MHRSVFLAALLAAPAAARPLRIVVLGDSLALGTGASRTDGGFVFPAYRALLLTHPGSTLDNVAIGGSTAADVLRLQVGRISAIAPDIAIVCVGGNDVVRRTPRAAFARTYADLLTALQRSAPHARLICCGVPDVAVSPLFSDDRAAVAALARDDDRAVRAAARAVGAGFADFYAISHRAAGNDRFLSGDRFHPSDTGYALLSAELVPALNAAAARAKAT